jgi:hypothetical protein
MGIRVEAPAEVQAQAVASLRARRGIEHAARDCGILLSGLRLRLTAPDPAVGGAVLAQANAHADGHPLRVQVTAPALEQAVDALCERTRTRLAATLGAWAPRSGPEPDRLTPAPVQGLEPTIARIKTYSLAVCAPQVAAAYMDAMDYEVHLFIDQETGQTCAVRSSEPGGYHLAWLRRAVFAPQAPLPLLLDSHPAPMLSATAAAQRLDRTGDAHLLFAEPTTGRGYLMYRRYDGHYALITGDTAAQRPTQAAADHEAGFRVLAGSRA